VAILVPSALLKFAGAKTSIHVFTAVGAEPWGRYAAGVAEATACVLLLRPRSRAFGAGLALAVLFGALAAHLTKLGIEVDGDYGFFFANACVAFVAAAFLLVTRRADLVAALRKRP
jgi:hypothetical protein